MAEAKLTASSAAQSFMVRVNLVPFTGTMEGEKVVSGASRSATLNGLVLVDGNRTPETSILGFAGTPDPNDLGQQLLEGVASVIDRTYFVPQRTPGIALDPNEKWLGHELGRALSLVHILPGNNLMDNVNVAEIKLRDATKGDPPPDQVGIIRSQALTQRIPID